MEKSERDRDGSHNHHHRYHRHYQRISLGFFTRQNPIRKFCIRIISWIWFDRLIVFCVVSNTIVLTLTDYTDAWADGPNSTIWINSFIDKCNSVSSYIFLAEALFKIMAMGLYFGDRAYLSDAWNRLDLIIVISGFLTSMNFKGIKIGYVRVLRVLRPLRTLHTLPGLKILTNSLLASLPALANVFILLMFCMLVFGILGMEIYRGSHHFRCRVTPYPVILPPNGSFNYPPNASYISMVQQSPAEYICPYVSMNNVTSEDIWDTPQDCFWPVDASENIPMVCNEDEGVGRQCQNGFICGSNFDIRGNPRFIYLTLSPWNQSASDDALFNSNLNFGLPSFDNLGQTWLILLQTITASGWMVLTQTTQATASPVVAGIYFTTLMYMGMCFLLQLNMAVLFTEFEKAKDLQAKKMREEMERQSIIVASLPSSDRKKMMSGTEIFRKMTTIARGHGHIIIQSSFGRQWRQFRVHVLKIIVSNAFISMGLFVTVGNILVLALDYHDIDREKKNNLETANFTFMLFFGIESAMKMVGMGFKTFWKDKFNRFDLLTVFMGIIEAAINPPSFVDGDPGAGGFFTAFRAARAFKLARLWKSLNLLLMSIVNSFGEVLNFLLFLLLFMLIFSLVGMELFATKYQFDPSNYHMPFNNSNPQTRLHRSNFDSIVWAAFTVFQILTYDNFPSVMYDGWISVGVAAPIYVSLVIVLGVFVVMNMFSAILVQAVMDGKDNEDSDDQDEDEPLSMYKNMRTKSVRIARRAMRLLMRFQIPESIQSPRNQSRKLLKMDRSLFLFSHSNPIRTLATFILNCREYTWCMSAVIFLSCVDTALDSPLEDSTTGVGYVLEQSNLAFAIIFTTEMAINIISRGFIFGPNAYVKDSWRVLDGFIVCVSILPYCMGNNGRGALSGLRSLRAFRALRPLRVINKLPSLKIVVNTLFRCIPDVARALLFFLFMLFLFGLMSLALFKGATYTCSVSPYNYGLGTGTPVNPPWFPSNYTGDFNVIDVSDLKELDVMTFPKAWNHMGEAQRDPFRGIWNTTGCGPFKDSVAPTSRDICLCFADQNGTTWKPLTPQRFDNILLAVAGLFELTTMEGWTATCLACIDSIGENMQPVPNHSPITMLYWWLFIIICAFFITNLFIGVLCDSFSRETYGSLVTDEQIQWIKLQNKVLAMSPKHIIPCPKQPLRALCFKIDNDPRFDHFITLAIIFNTACMAAQVYGQSEKTEVILNTMNNVFSVIFVLEAGIKIASSLHEYFNDNWNRFDFLIVLFTIMSFFLQAIKVNVGTTAKVVRVFRVGRTLRLIKKTKNMKNLFDTLVVSLPAVANVVSLLSLLYYIFAAVAVQLFAKIGFDGNMINENQNFQNFWTAFQTLIGFSTGENWDNFMWEVYNYKPATNPTCEDRSFNASMCGFNNSYGCIPLDGCGSPLILPFMYIFFLVMGYIGINLFSGIVVDAIGDASSDCPVNVNTLAEFSNRWAQFDPSGSGLITAEELTDFLYTVYPPFGFKGVPGFTRRRVAIAIGELGIPIYDKQYVHFKDVPRALVQRVLSEGNREKHAEITRVMEQLGINKQFDDMWFRAHGKKMQLHLTRREIVPSREYAATVVIQRFFEKVKLEHQRREKIALKRMSIIATPDNPIEIPKIAKSPTKKDFNIEQQEVKTSEVPQATAIDVNIQ